MENFDLKDLMANINLDNYKGIDKNLDEKIEQLRTRQNEDLRKKLRQKINNSKNSRMSKSIRQDNQINMLKENTLFKNAQNEEDIKKAIDTIASSMTKDSRQKKNVKKQMEKLVDKMSDIKLE